jgi:hypothetical protein
LHLVNICLQLRRSCELQFSSAFVCFYSTRSISGLSRLSLFSEMLSSLNS